MELLCCQASLELITSYGVPIICTLVILSDEGCCTTLSCNIPLPGHIACCPAPDPRQPATKHCTQQAVITCIVLSSWWWALKCLKHVQHIISAINHSVASSWFFFSTLSGIVCCLDNFLFPAWHSVSTQEWIELNCIWVWALLGLMHLGLTTGPLCPMFYTKLKEPCSFIKFPDGPYT